MNSRRDLVELVGCAADGDADAWSEIVDQMENLVWSVVRGFRLGDADAHDAAQLTWLRAVENLHRVTDPERLGLWLATIARRECMRTIEKSSRTSSVDPQVSFSHLESRSDPAAEISNRSAAEQILAALETISADCQSLLRLVLCDPPLSYAEISEVLGIAVGTIGPRRQRCLSRLRSAAGL